jgi:DNA polymerase-3 subunit epsilon
MEFVAIDFETADFHPESACSIGLVRMNAGGDVLGTQYSLIKPPSFCRFAQRNIEIHGIRPSDVKDSHDFSYLWPNIQWFIGDSFLVAHNAPFDMKVLSSLLSCYRIEIPDIKYLCSLQISRRVWPRLESHALTSLSAHFALDYNAHNALDDASNCGKVFLKACSGRMNDMDDLRRFLITKGIEPKSLKSFSSPVPSYYAPYPI